MSRVKDLQNKIFREILSSKIYDLAKRTPIELAKKLSIQFDNNVYMKREDLQSIFSFKIRGAYHKILNEKKKNHFREAICVSAGNHGQGVAVAAFKLGIKATVVMPLTTPQIKISAVKSLGGKVVLHGDSYSEAESYCLKNLMSKDKLFIPPFDDLYVISGQGTVGKEIYEDLSSIDYIFIPIGGGGLISGVASYIKKIDPRIKIIGVEAEESCGMQQSIHKDERVVLKTIGTFADDVAVRKVGVLTFVLCKKLVDDIIVVSNDEICSAIGNVYTETRAVLEPSGALSIVGVKKYLSTYTELKKKSIVAINSGANMNFQRLQFVAERAMIGDKKESLKAYIFLGIENQKEDDHKHLCARLKKYSYTFYDLTNNDLAKDHIRHMVRGYQPHFHDKERVHRFNLPDRPEALLNFLEKFSSKWNISLFHHRSHGTDTKKILIGFEISRREEKEFDFFLKKEIGNLYICESLNQAYEIFL